MKLAFCDHKAAKYAVENWHYSQRLPVGTLVKIGVWEGGKFIGCVLFGRGANYLAGAPYALEQTEVCELVRVALKAHQAPVSKIAACALRFLHSTSPGTRLVLSYADPAQGHHGGIYQAMNWVYVGESAGGHEYFYQGRWQHSREITAGAFGSQGKLQDWGHLPQRKTLGKHKYLYPLDEAMRTQIQPLSKPYPKRDPGVWT